MEATERGAWRIEEALVRGLERQEGPWALGLGSKSSGSYSDFYIKNVIDTDKNVINTGKHVIIANKNVVNTNKNVCNVNKDSNFISINSIFIDVYSIFTNIAIEKALSRHLSPSRRRSSCSPGAWVQVVVIAIFIQKIEKQFLDFGSKLHPLEN